MRAVSLSSTSSEINQSMFNPQINHTMKTKPQLLKLLLGLVLLPFMLKAQTENYNVVKVNGGLYNVTQKQKMASGNSVAKSDQVEFNALSNSAFVISRDNGRFVMVPENNLSVTAGTVLKPLTRRTAITTRSASSEATPESDLFRYFGKDKFLFIQPQTQIWIDTVAMKLDSGRILVAKYRDDTGKDISKKILLKNGKLVVNVEDIFTEKDANGNLKLYPVELFIYDTNSKELYKKASFTPVLADKNTLLSEIKVIMSTLPADADKKVVLEEIETFIFATYGQVNTDDLIQFMASNVGFKID